MKSLRRLSLYALLMFSAPTLALDGKKTGPFMALGLGPALQSEFVVGGFGEEFGGHGTSFKAGVGVGAQVVGYFVHQQLWSSGENSTRFTGFGLGYYFNPRSDSPYAHMAIGLGDSTSQYLPRGPDATIMAGIGLQLSNQFSIEFSHFQVGNDNYPDSTIASTQLTLLIHWF